LAPIFVAGLRDDERDLAEIHVFPVQPWMPKMSREPRPPSRAVKMLDGGDPDSVDPAVWDRTAWGAIRGGGGHDLIPFSGQCFAWVHDVLPAAELLARLVTETEPRWWRRSGRRLAFDRAEASNRDR
jgi:hypothetical protein